MGGMAGTSAAAIARVKAYKFGDIYGQYVAKVERKGKTVQDLRYLIEWLTGYDGAVLDREISEGVTMEQFFAGAPKLNPNANLITGVICGVRVEEITDSFMQQVRWLDKIVDELAKGKKLESITRKPK